MNPVVAARRSTQLFVHHLAQNGAVPAHHIIAALSAGRNDAVLYDFDEVFDSYFNKLTQTSCFVTPLGRRVKFTGRGERTASPGRRVCWSKQANLCRWRRVPENFTVPRAFESTIVQENVRVKFEDSVHSNKRGGLDA